MVAWLLRPRNKRRRPAACTVLAEAHHLPFAPHDCTGPVTLMASVHLCMHVPNALTQEVVRAFNHGWYPRLVTALPRIEAGYVYAPEALGLGLALRPEVFARTDLLIQASVPQE